ncbi:MAG TPA: hypothetical protein VLW65_17435 [Bryobacteraceae bacterium]|nr:hypothetical protein [Bryobacteraceae bacterium]
MNALKTWLDILKALITIIAALLGDHVGQVLWTSQMYSGNKTPLPD